MRLRELLIVEDGEGGGASAGATTSSDIASVAYPLFVRGRTRKEKRKNARAAVGQGPDNAPAYIGRGVFENVDEAHVVDNNNVIYRLDKDRPMSDTEVLMLGGAGRYSLEGLRQKARREAVALAQDLEVEHGGAFRRSAENVKQLANTLNTIVAAYNELKRIRRKGGRGSRGITDEDANFIRECMAVAQQWSQRFIREDEESEVERQGQLISWPAGTTMVDVSDVYDWYKLGMAISDLDDFTAADFHQGPPHTIIAFNSEEEEAKLAPLLKNLKFNIHDIDEPGDVAKAKAFRASDLIKHFSKTGT